MASIHPAEDNILRHHEKLTTLVSEPNDPTVQRAFQRKVVNADSPRRNKSNSADNILGGGSRGGKESRKTKKRDRTKRPQTITYVTEEAEHVFEAFCSNDKSRSSSAPQSFNAKINLNIGEDKMQRLKEIVKGTSGSEAELEKPMKVRKKKSFFNRIRERLRALNKKQPLFERANRERERELEKEEKQKFTQKIFESFRAKRNAKKSKKTKGTLGKKESDIFINQSTDDPFDQPGHSIDQRGVSKKNGTANHINEFLGMGDFNIPTPSSPSYPFSPSGLGHFDSQLPEVIQATAEERRKLDLNNNGYGDDSVPPSVPSSPPPPLFPPPPSSTHGPPYLAFFDSVSPAGSSVDRKRDMSKGEGLPPMKYIDDDDDDDDDDDTEWNKPDNGGESYNGRKFVNGADFHDGTGASQSSVDSKELTDFIDSGCEDVLDKYAQVANLLDKISQEVTTELGALSETNDSTLSLAMEIASKRSYQLYQAQLNDLLQQLNEPLLQQVALVFSVTRSAIHLVGINSQNASRLKDYLLRYYNSFFAPQVASEGGLESLTDSET